MRRRRSVWSRLADDVWIAGGRLLRAAGGHTVTVFGLMLSAVAVVSLWGPVRPAVAVWSVWGAARLVGWVGYQRMMRRAMRRSAFREARRQRPTLCGRETDWPGPGHFGVTACLRARGHDGDCSWRGDLSGRAR